MKKRVFRYKPYYQYSSLDGNRFSFSGFNSNLPCNIFTNSSTSVHDCCLTILFNSHIRRIVRTSTIQNYEVKEEQEFLRDFIINKIFNCSIQGYCFVLSTGARCLMDNLWFLDLNLSSSPRTMSSTSLASSRLFVLLVMCLEWPIST